MCSNQTLTSFQNDTLITSILFNASGDDSAVVAALNSTYKDVAHVTTYQDELSQINAAGCLDYGMSINIGLLFACLLFGEFSIAFIAVLQGSKSLLIALRVRSEKFATYARRYAFSYGILLLIGISTSLFLGLLGSSLAINSLNATFFNQGSMGEFIWIPYPLVLPLGEFGILSLLLIINWGLILGWFLAREKMEFKPRTTAGK